MARFKANLTVVAFLGVSVLVCSAHAQATRYVDDDAPLGGDGLSWDTAYKYLQDALAVPVPHGRIRVAGGIYRPDRDETGNVTPGDREATFRLADGANISGGYAGLADLDNPNERQVDFYVTVLSGDLHGDDGHNFAHNDENAFHVVTGNGAGRTAVLNGVTVTGGNANLDVSPFNCGGGMSNVWPPPRPTLRNCKFIGNAGRSGGGMCNSTVAEPLLIDCAFIGNVATASSGGGLFNTGRPVLRNCIFVGNSAIRDGGGMAAWLDSYDPTLINCTFTENRAERYGGGLHIMYSDPRITNCVFWDNHDGGGTGRSAQIYKVYATPIVEYSCIQDIDPDDLEVFPGAGNIDDDPLFVAGAGGCYYLSQLAAGQTEQSPCVDTGMLSINSPLATYTTRTDGVGDADPVDMGYHYGSEATGEDCNGNGIADECDALADMNGDGAFTLSELGAFVGCFTGPCWDASCALDEDECCHLADDDGDGDVDLRDVSALQRQF